MNVISMLFGAALVAIGVLATALADRIRGIGFAREVVATRSSTEPQVRARRVDPKSRDGAGDVIAALVAAGYKRQIATEAAWGCNADERTSIEGWAAAALRRASQGVPS
jgi:hypothetical protein